MKGLVHSLDGQRYRAGDRLFITITAPGLLAERAEIWIRCGAITARPIAVTPSALRVPVGGALTTELPYAQ